jgi:antirestriction protein ArdC
VKNDRIQDEALARAVSGQSMANYATIIAGFVARGIPESKVLPRENVFTYQAWRKLGRQVRRGEHGVKVCTWISIQKSASDSTTGEERLSLYKRPWTATVFHVSQTDPVLDGEGEVT